MGKQPGFIYEKNKNSFRVQLEIESRIGGTWTQSDFVLTSLFCSISKCRWGGNGYQIRIFILFSETKDFEVNIWLGFWFFLWSDSHRISPPDRFSPWLTIDFWFWLWITTSPTSPYDWWQEYIDCCVLPAIEFSYIPFMHAWSVSFLNCSNFFETSVTEFYRAQPSIVHVLCPAQDFLEKEYWKL